MDNESLQFFQIIFDIRSYEHSANDTAKGFCERRQVAYMNAKWIVKTTFSVHMKAIIAQTFMNKESLQFSKILVESYENSANTIFQRFRKQILKISI